MVTVEEELRRMGIQEGSVSEVAKAIRNAAVSSTLPVDGILSGLKMIMESEKPKLPTLNTNWLIPPGKTGLY
jgi:hypothetical protein